MSFVKTKVTYDTVLDSDERIYNQERIQEIRESHDIRHLINNHSSMTQEKRQKKLFDILKNKHPCKNNPTKTECINQNNPFGFVDNVTDQSVCLDFTKSVYKDEFKNYTQICRNNPAYIYKVK